MVKMEKCAVIGCGFVGAEITYTLMEDGIFSEIVMIDNDMAKAKGNEMDLNHGLPFMPKSRVYVGAYEDLKDAGIIIITAGAGQKPGETRTDLVGRNVKILKAIIDDIIKWNKEAILLLVSNPVDTLTYVAQEISGYPVNRVIGSGTLLDTNRLKYMLGERLDVDHKQIHAYILGEHGDSEFPVYSSANVSGIRFEDFTRQVAPDLEEDELYSIYNEVRNSAYQVIQYKKATYYAIAQSVQRICEVIIRDERCVLPVSTRLNGEYGLNGLCISVPCIVGRDGIRKVVEIPLNEKEQEAMKKSAEAIKNTIAVTGY